uniref:Reverse transcriptase domain-containing protein n=1 Tax=Tanacetum cinerariifolium TaxID=118510 RepID=A0A6L2NHU4_TANCI|nr:reverse transcriptase domain-containing protein [Tanacetum cinerariifolium]
MFTRLGARDKNVFTRLGEKRSDVHSRLGLKVTSRHKHAHDKRCTSSGRSAKKPNHRKREARNLVQSYVRHANRAPECVRIFRFMHGVTNPDLIKRLNDNILKSVDEMMSMITTFLRGEVVAANQLHMEVKSRMTPATTLLLGFSDEISWPLSQISLTYHHRPGLRKIQAVPFTAYEMLKFLVKRGIVMLHRNTIIPAECRMVAEALSESPPNEPSFEKGIKVAIHLEYPEQTVTISESLSEKGKMELCDLLRKNLDIFAWKPTDMTSVQRRRDVPGSRCKHERNKILPRKDKSNHETTFTKNAKRGTNPQKAGKLEHVLIKVRSEVPTFFQNLKELHKKVRFPMAVEARKAFQKMKRHIAELPLLTAPKPKEDLVMYLCAAREAINVILPKSKSYHASKMQEEWQNSTLNSQHMTTTDREQVLADFIAKRPDEDAPNVEILPKEEVPKPWTLFTNGSSCLEGSRAGLILTNPGGTEFTYALRFEFNASNNKAKYEALMAGMWIAKQMDEILAVTEEEGHSSMTPLLEYLKDGMLPAESKKARSIKINPRQYFVIGGILYCKSFLKPWLWCVGPLQAEYVVREIHEGSCSMHPGPSRNTRSQIKKFFYDNIVCRFSLPGEIISNNEKLFRDNPFKDWCDKLNIKQIFASVKHQQTNKQVERANRNLGEGILARLSEENKNYVKEVPHVLWAHRASIKTGNGHTPFSLTCGTEAVIPVEIGMPSLRCVKIDRAENDDALLLNLDVLEEEQEKAAIQEVKSKAKMERYYNAKVRSIIFKPGDFVYRSNEASHAKDGGKLGLKWERPYDIVEALRKGAYNIRNESGDILPWTWDVKDLKK